MVSSRLQGLVISAGLDSGVLVSVVNGMPSGNKVECEPTNRWVHYPLQFWVARRAASGKELRERRNCVVYERRVGWSNEPAFIGEPSCCKSSGSFAPNRQKLETFAVTTAGQASGPSCLADLKSTRARSS